MFVAFKEVAAVFFSVAIFLLSLFFFCGACFRLLFGFWVYFGFFIRLESSQRVAVRLVLS